MISKLNGTIEIMSEPLQNPTTIVGDGESQIRLSELTSTFNKIINRLTAKEKEVSILRHSLTGNEDREDAYKALKKVLNASQEELYLVKNQLTDRKAQLELMNLERDQLEKKVIGLENTLKINIEHHRIDKESALTEEKMKHQKMLGSLKNENEVKVKEVSLTTKTQIEFKNNEIQDLKRKLAKLEGDNRQLEKKLSSHQCISETCKAEKASQKQYYTQALAELEEELQRARKRTSSQQDFQQQISKKSKKVTFDDNKGDNVPSQTPSPTQVAVATAKKTILKKDERKSHHKIFVDKFLPKQYNKGDFVQKW